MMGGTAGYAGRTAPEICAIALMKLGLSEGDVAADIGCGSGSVSVAMAGEAGRVYAIDRRHDAVVRTRRAVAASGAGNVSVLEGEAAEVLPELEDLDAAFIGGTRDLRRILELLVRQLNGTVVLNAVLLETAALAVSEMKRLGIFQEAIQIQISRAAPLAGRTIFHPINPVTMVVGRVG
ncbi:MAG: precorrin-6Y C5,15-methyltransferase (decarboxylating) subunit CbiT [Methanoculleaceae archaeon]